ncbi:MAG: transketolase C-terminal domain-containing protein, partial [Eubacteriales bacterium]|nr:transketolase C-terminal domain-containing protein [Eubacteriales bacterium]
RTFDVGIAEQHAVTFAAGLALNGYKPVVAIYSTFLQRSYDQLLVDVCLQKLPVIFMLDRAGNVGNDGETHHGVFDFSYLSHMPGMTVMAPKDSRELEAMMDYAHTLNGPCAIRYPKGQVWNCPDSDNNQIIDGNSELLAEGKDVSLVAIGKMVQIAMEARTKLKSIGYEAEVINARFLKPVDMNTILTSVKKTGNMVTLEDNVIIGGFGSGILSLLASEGVRDLKTLCLGWPDCFIPHGNMEQLFAEYKLDADSVAKRVGEFIEGKA